MTRFQQIGGCRVWMRGDEGAFVLHPRHFVALRTAWQSGERFFEGTDVYGDVLVLSLHNVVALALATAQGVARCDDDQREQELASP